MRVVERESGFCEVYNAPRSVEQYLKLSVAQPMRYFEEEPEPHWCVYKDHIVGAVHLGYITLGHVDYSGLSEPLQVTIAQEKPHWTVREQKKPVPKKREEPTNDFRTLFLTPDAPDFIIDAVWKALARKHHPDTGGDAEAFRRYNEAYKKIKRKR